MSSPQYHHHHHQHRQPYKSSDDDRPRVSYGALDAPSPMILDPRSEDLDSPLGCVCQFSRACVNQIVFLVANAVAACGVSLLLLLVLSCALVLLPFCGAGLVLFRLLFRLGVIEFLARLDAVLANFVSPHERQIQLYGPTPAAQEQPLHPLLQREERAFDRIASGLNAVSLTSMKTLLYFIILKSVLALLGLLVVGLVLWAPLALLYAVFASSPNWSGSADPPPPVQDATLWDSICGGLVMALVFVVAVGSLDLVTQLSCASTRFFCCERVQGSAFESSAVPARVRPKMVVVRLKQSQGRSPEAAADVHQVHMRV